MRYQVHIHNIYLLQYVLSYCTKLQYPEAEKIALRGTPEAAHAAGLGPVKPEEGAAAGLKDLALVDVERLRIRVVDLAHRGVEGGDLIL